MKPFFLFIVLSAFFWSTADVVLRTISSKISAVAASLGVGIGMIIAMLSLFVFTSDQSLMHLITKDAKWFLLAILAGMVNSGGFFFFTKFLQHKGTFTEGMPVILIGVLLMTTLYGVFIFKDPFSWRIMAGVTCAGVAIWLLG